MTALTPQRRGLFDRIGFPSALAPGLLAVIVFVIGDGIETVWISNYLVTAHGYSVPDAGVMITLYGIAVAIGAFLSGALSDAIGPRKVMMLGAASFIVFDILFIVWALPSDNFALLAVLYGMRGFGYPLFAYGFLTWVMKVTPAEHRSAASGWFWFAFTLGIQILGSYVASFALPLIGEVGTLWLGLALAILGAAIGLLFVRGGNTGPAAERKPIGQALFGGLSIIWRHPKVGLGGVLKIINLSGPFALLVFYLPFLVGQIGMEQTQAILVFTFFGIFVVLGNLFWGYLGDAIGWRNCMQWIGTPLCFIGYLYLYFVPLVAGPNFWLIVIGGIIMSAGVSSFVPLTPLMVAFAPGETGAALSIVNFGAGLAAIVGPGLVAALYTAVGTQGVVVTIAALYAAAFVLLFFLRLPGNARTMGSTPDETPSQAGMATQPAV